MAPIVAWSVRAHRRPSACCPPCPARGCCAGDARGTAPCSARRELHTWCVVRSSRLGAASSAGRLLADRTLAPSCLGSFSPWCGSRLLLSLMPASAAPARWAVEPRPAVRGFARASVLAVGLRAPLVSGEPDFLADPVRTQACAAHGLAPLVAAAAAAAAALWAHVGSQRHSLLRLPISLMPASAAPLRAASRPACRMKPPAPPPWRTRSRS